MTTTTEPAGARDGGGAIPRFPWTLAVDEVDGVDGSETVLYRRPPPGSPTATVTVTAPDGAWCEVEQATDGWPLLVLWRDARPGTNVLGVEPSTSRDGGRAQAESDGEVIWLGPGESRAYRTVLRVGR